MDSNQLYHADSYLREMEARVTLVDDAWVALDQRVFYAQSGGLSAAHGILVWADAQTRVSDVRRKGNVLWHHVEGSIPPEGTRVHGLLDWERRTDFVTEVEQRINAEVEADREVHIRFLPRAQAFSIPHLIRTSVNLLPEGIEVVRICEIVGLDLQADGGTNVARTGEVGSIRVRGHESKGVSTSGCAWPSRDNGQGC
jgi:misacylated tRNA(Ala) deacylase